MDLREELTRLIDLLAEEDIEYALCGGLALAIHGHPRFTRDIDLLVRPGDADLLASAVAGIGYAIDAGELPFDWNGPRQRLVRRLSKVEGTEMLTLDLILLPDWLQEVWDTREVFSWEGREITVVSREGLAAMKRAAGRPQDLADLDKLETGGDADA